MEKMQSGHLALSVITEGKTYGKRLEIMQSSRSKSAKLAMLQTICKRQAIEDSPKIMQTWDCEIVSQAAMQVYEHMIEDCEK